eukprot:CAMPEP_0168389002 /NCGR_PEP_ID=MMETSP0228-20121227/16741_1 /TAXON_ID=133427 /ORGANISM="Protoceratium reticulatum, Strain CCCM 535 (=CCMP 1889)" /LENGTH=76 /DNA_ID=CAMNT_0008402265 /DNA_START=9 /DNA_END=237 /DNA_ORIENTATION=+
MTPDSKNVPMKGDYKRPRHWARRWPAREGRRPLHAAFAFSFFLLGQQQARHNFWQSLTTAKMTNSSKATSPSMTAR